MKKKNSQTVAFSLSHNHDIAVLFTSLSADVVKKNQPLPNWPKKKKYNNHNNNTRRLDHL